MPISNELYRDLIQIVSSDGILPNDQVDRYRIDGLAPQAVILPASVPEIQDVLTYAADQKLSVVPVGNGTKLSIGNPPEKVDLLLSTSRLNEIIEYEPADLTVTVQAGIRLTDLQKRLAAHGQYLALDPLHSDDATLGGIAATNASGPLRMRYGAARDCVLGLRVIQSSGTVVKSGGKVVKNVAGYDLNKLYIGSFGTLGIITEVALKLYPLPEVERTVRLTFQEISAAMAVALEISSSQLLPNFLSLFINGIPFTEIAEPSLLIGLDGHRESVEWQIDRVQNMAQQNGAISVSVYEGAQQDALRRSMRSFPAGGWAKNVVSKANVRLTDVEGFINTTLATSDDPHCFVQMMALISNGVVYIALSGFPNEVIPAKPVAKMLAKLREAAMASGGNLIIESAPVEIKRQIDSWGTVSYGLDIMKRIKVKLDPIGLLNPGRFVGGI